MKKFTGIFFILLALIAVSCGPSVEGEQKSWNDNVQKMNALKSSYPVFASFIDSKISSAKAVWTQAESITDKEKKAEKMQEANNYFETGCLGHLVEMKDKMTKLDSKISDVKSLKMGEKGDEKRFANEAVNEAQNSLTTASQYLTDGKTEISSEPCEVIEKVYALLTKAYDDLMIAQNKFSEKKDTVKSSNSGSNNNTQPPADIKCEYCGTSNPAANSKCSSCGAPLKK